VAVAALHRDNRPDECVDGGATELARRRGAGAGQADGEQDSGSSALTGLVLALITLSFRGTGWVFRFSSSSSWFATVATALVDGRSGRIRATAAGT